MRWEVRSPWQLLEGWILANSTLSLLSLTSGWQKKVEIQMKTSTLEVSYRFELGIKQRVHSCLPDVCISLSVQAGQTDLFPTHPLPLFLSGEIWRIHGAGWSCKTSINLTIILHHFVTWGRHSQVSHHFSHKRIELNALISLAHCALLLLHFLAYFSLSFLYLFLKN